MGVIVSVLDISETSIAKVKPYIKDSFADPALLPSDNYDIAISNLVAQHMTDIDLIHQIKNVLKSLKQGGVFAMQYASSTKPELYREDLEAQRQGLVRRSPEHMERIVKVSGGQVVYKGVTKYFDPDKATDDACWNNVKIGRA